MSNLRRIFIVESDEFLNQNIVNTLHKEGYIVQSAFNGSDAVRILWSDTYDVVVSDIQTSGASGFDLLQWLRSYRPNTYIILMGEPAWRMRALESGATSYLEKPFDFRAFKEELRRLLQQTGFSADLDSFDLLDVIQMITMSRRSMALQVNTGLEERGMLRFQNGDLIWAEYGTLCGEEAFFALAAHKNGSVVQQPWNGGGRTNVTQPLSHLIFQALQYRTKYAHGQDDENSAAPLEDSHGPLSSDEYDDSPFVFLSEEEDDSAPTQDNTGQEEQTPVVTAGPSLPPEDVQTAREWWQRTEKMVHPVRQQDKADTFRNIDQSIASTIASNQHELANGRSASLSSSRDQAAQSGSQPALPSWLTDRPTSSQMPVVRSDSASEKVSQSFPPASPSTNQFPLSGQASPPRKPANALESGWNVPAASPAPWPRADEDASPVPSADESWMYDDKPPVEEVQAGLREEIEEEYNYPALISALQTLGYSIHGFIAAAIVSLDGRPIAQVTVDDLDISRVCQSMSSLLQHAAQTVEQEQWGGCEQFAVTSTNRRIFVRMLSEACTAFQVLITAYEVDFTEYMDIMNNVEGAIEAALT